MGRRISPDASCGCEGAVPRSGMVLYKTARSKRRTIPDWVKVQAGEDAGATLIEIWREYAARAARPYDISGFRKEFRKWQAAAPAVCQGIRGV
jgi:hypothetical protein